LIYQTVVGWATIKSCQPDIEALGPADHLGKKARHHTGIETLQSKKEEMSPLTNNVLTTSKVSQAYLLMSMFLSTNRVSTLLGDPSKRKSESQFSKFSHQ